MQAFFERLGACGQVLSCVRPLDCGGLPAAGPVWRYADRVHIGSASLNALRDQPGFPDPVSSTVCPYPSSVLPTSPTAPACHCPFRRRREPGSPPCSSLAPRRCAPFCSPAPPRQASWASRQHPGQPRIVGPAAPARPADDRHGAGDEETPEITLAHLGYFAQLRLAAGRVLPRNQTEPGCEVATVPEALHRRCESLDRHCGDRPDPWIVMRRFASSS